MKRLDGQLGNIRDLQDMTNNHSKLIERARLDIDKHALGKTDLADFKQHAEEMEKRLSAIDEHAEITRNMVFGCENYLEKYQPLFTLRQIAEAFDFVASSKDKQKMKKYSEAKVNLYHHRILLDKGEPNLQGTIDQLRVSLRTGEHFERDLCNADLSRSIGQNGGVSTIQTKNSAGARGKNDNEPENSDNDGALKDSIEQEASQQQKANLSIDMDVSAVTGAGINTGDIDTQVIQLVSQEIEQKSRIFEDKLHYWRDEVNNRMTEKFNEISNCL